MAVTSYSSVNGMLIGENAASVKRDYLHDALGSVTAVANASGTIQNRYRYRPFGGTLSKTGIDPDPKFQWIGTLGYRVAAKSHYVRARHYMTSTALWTSRDPLSPIQPQYQYSRPTVAVDPSGLQQGPLLPSTEELRPCEHASGSFSGSGTGRCLGKKNYLRIKWPFGQELPPEQALPKAFGMVCDPKKECEWLKQRRSQVQSAINMMSQPGAEPPQVSDAFRPWGMTCCCKTPDGRVGWVTWLHEDPFPLEKGVRTVNPNGVLGPCAWECLLLHEKFHRDQLKALPSDAARIAACFDPPQVLAMELDAYRAELKCLDEKLKECPDNNVEHSCSLSPSS